MEKCEMIQASVASIYKQLENKSVFACPLSEQECPYKKAEGRFNTTDNTTLSNCNSKGLVERTGLIDLKKPEMQKYLFKGRFSENGIVITPSNQF